MITSIVIAVAGIVGFSMFGLIVVKAWTLSQALKGELNGVKEVDK